MQNMEISYYMEQDESKLYKIKRFEPRGRRSDVDALVKRRKELY